MSYCVFMHRPDSIYRDSPAEHYQFPKQYFARAVGSIGDWILYLAPSKSSGLKGYFAIARVQDIVPDPTSRDMFMAVIEPGSYLEFANPVAFNDANPTTGLGGGIYHPPQSSAQLTAYDSIIARNSAPTAPDRRDRPATPTITAPRSPALGAVA